MRRQKYPIKLVHPVVLLGAGATRGALQKNNVPPPLDADLFEIAGQITDHGTRRGVKFSQRLSAISFVVPAAPESQLPCRLESAQVEIV